MIWQNAAVSGVLAFEAFLLHSSSTCCYTVDVLLYRVRFPVSASGHLN